MANRHLRQVATAAAAAAGAALGVYAGYAAVTYARYGSASSAKPGARGALLDCFMPAYDVAERESIAVHAPAEVTLAAAVEMDLTDTAVSRAIFRARELLLGSVPDPSPHPKGLVAMTTSIGWRVLAEEPGREVVVGAVTQPWMANVVFRPLAPEAFITFDEPDYVKIAWTLRADPLGDGASRFSTETRAIATDAEARRKFRRYWSLLSPGIILIRKATLRPLKAEAERRAARSG